MRALSLHRADHHISDLDLVDQLVLHLGIYVHQAVLITWLNPVDKMEMQLYSLSHSLAIGNCTKNNVVSSYFPPLPHSNFGPGIAVLAPIS